jgi:hypothetical protein
VANLFDFIFNHGFAVAVGVIPLTFSLLLAAFTKSWRRWLAIALILFAGSIFVFELYSGSLEGNLTGLIWIITTPFIAIAIVTISVLEWSSRSRRFDHADDAGKTRINKRTEPN